MHQCFPILGSNIFNIAIVSIYVKYASNDIDMHVCRDIYVYNMNVYIEKVRGILMC